jgi:hypothetical protein
MGVAEDNQMFHNSAMIRCPNLCDEGKFYLDVPVEMEDGTIERVIEEAICPTCNGAGFINPPDIQSVASS